MESSPDGAPEACCARSRRPRAPARSMRRPGSRLRSIALAADGIDAVRVEPLAKALAVTKGSFYWHFADRRALIDAMLSHWSGRTHRRDPRTGAARWRSRRSLAPARRPLHAAQQCARACDRTRDPRTGPQRRGGRARGAGGRRRAAASWSARCSSGSAGRCPKPGRARSWSMRYLFGQSLLDPKSVKAADIALAIDALLAPPR